MRQDWRDAALSWLYAAPALALMALINMLPIAETVRLSGEFDFLARDPRLLPVLWTTLRFTAVSVALELALGLAFALLLAAPFRGRGFARAAVLIPWALPTAAMAMAWRWIFNADHGALGFLGWLGDPSGAFWAIVLADVWKTTPFMTILLMSGLASIPEELYEAAAIDGAGPARRFFLITLPALKPTIVVSVIFRAIQSFGAFDLIWVLTGGGPAGKTQTIALYVYDTVFRYQEIAYGCALTLVMALCLMGLAACMLLAGRTDEAR